ncbi:uncharacterized protein LOC127286880 isoform X2 [Leptopilina boulardi]|uniref:uncharacterized protein LOC127286880 isoform X2 n=1 Tax=Leptopilina boulardi TaxID=63433 RepID=UPI0021F5582C|nr:uncharacterized protein LOC127286880 isoform X2 [Leptopilina boulardi]
MECHSNPEVVEIDAFDESEITKSCTDQRHLRVKPIRIIQLIFSSLLLGLTIGLTHPNHWVLDYGNLTLLGIVNFSFFVIEIVDAVSQFGNDPIPDTPMFVFGSCGVILFLIACGGSTATFAKSPKNSSSLLLAIGIISFFNALLHLLDVVLIFLFGY